MLRTAWTDNVSNEEVLQRASASSNLKVIVNRQIRFVGHIVRKRPGWSKAKGLEVDNWQRKTFMDWLSFCCGEQWKINDILKICQERNEHILIANVRVW